ncbi:MAG: hypothetical protein JSV84_12250 [Gemmatimonadota bacterium]|nr:MAG: hypothetical protein JSV84_12250 [Gemmatimonadota bacterium]
MDVRFLDILGNKPQLVSEFPTWMLSDTEIDELRKIDDLAIVEIAGRDSIAAAIESAKTRNLDAILPTIAYTATEYGDWEIPFQKVEFLKGKMQECGVKVFLPLVLGSPDFWWKLCGRYASHLFREFGFYTPCIGCHLYLHAIRIPLAKKIRCQLIIGGEREKHDDRVKINQIDTVLDAYENFMASFGIELLLPLRHIRSSGDIEGIIGEKWDEGSKQMQCVMSKNYLDRDNDVEYSKKKIERFLDEFAMKVAEQEVQKILK